jgi:hypothetical protein
MAARVSDIGSVRVYRPFRGRRKERLAEFDVLKP